MHAYLKLTVRETQLAKCVSRSLMNKEIAFELGLSIGTVKEYLYNLFRKCGVSNRTALALWQLENIAPAELFFE